MSRFVAILFTLSMLSIAACDDDVIPSDFSDSNLSDDGNYVLHVTHSIAGLKDLYMGSSHRISGDVVIEGVITATDLMGEYPNAIIVEDDSGAVELTVFISSSSLNDAFCICDLVRIRCTGLWIGSLGGNITIGNEPNPYGSLAVGYIYEEDLRSRVNIMKKNAARDAQQVSVSDFRPALDSRYIRLDNVEFVEGAGEMQYCDRNIETGQSNSKKHKMVDSNGDYFELYVPSTVDYADDIIPTGKGVIFCTLDRYYNSYSVRFVCHKQLFPDYHPNLL